MRRLRVMRIIARMNIGGAALQVAALMRGLDPERFDQRLYAGPTDPEGGDYLKLRAPDVPVQPVPTLGRGSAAGDEPRALAHLVAAVRQFRPDVVHTHGARAGLLGRIAAAAGGVPVRVHTFHEPPPRRGSTSAGLARQAERILARRADALVAAGTRLRDELVTAGVGRSGQYVVVPPGASLRPPPHRDAARRRLGLPLNGPVLVYVGGVCAAGRPDRLLTVARAVRHVVPDVHLVICGQGDRLIGTVADAWSDDLGITFLRWRADVETVYAAADLVLSVSDAAGPPLCLVEAALAGRAAVGIHATGAAEVIRHGTTGLLAPADPAALAWAAIALLRDDERRRRMSQAALAQAGQRFGTPRLVADIRDLYHGLALTRGLRAGRDRASGPRLDPPTAQTPRPVGTGVGSDQSRSTFSP